MTDGATADVPVIVISAHVSPGQASRALSLGARAVLEKPLDIPRFLDLVTTCFCIAEASCRPVQ
jgi:CheY-like chemotaxis protein